MIPAENRPSDRTLGLAWFVIDRLARVPGRRATVWHTALGFAVGWAMASPETHRSLQELRDDTGELCELVQVTTTWIAAGRGVSVGTAHEIRRAVAGALGIGAVPAAGLELLCDPRSTLWRISEDMRDALKIACRVAAEAGLLQEPLLDQVPLGPPHRIGRIKRGKMRCPWCGERACAVRTHEDGHKTGWCHACAQGGSVVGHTIRRWLGRRRPSSNGLRDPSMPPVRPEQWTRREGRPKTRRGLLRYEWDPEPKQRSPGGGGGTPEAPRPFGATGVGQAELVRRLGGVFGPIGDFRVDPRVTAWRSPRSGGGPKAVILLFEGVEMTIKPNGWIRIIRSATPEQVTAIWDRVHSEGA
jgi:hypothetical protein